MTVAASGSWLIVIRRATIPQPVGVNAPEPLGLNDLVLSGALRVHACSVFGRLGWRYCRFADPKARRRCGVRAAGVPS